MIEIGAKRFNTTGPCFPAEHYMLDALARLPDIEPFIASKLYFVLHAARQAGKTTALKALVKKMNATGKVAAVYCSLEVVQDVHESARCMAIIARQIADNAANYPPFFDRSYELQPRIEKLSDDESGLIVRQLLIKLCREAGKPVVVFFDEADCIPASSIISFLRQLRDGYINRDEAPFPMSIALVGMRNIRDFKARIRPDSDTLGSASPFNIIQESLTLRNFTEEEVGELYAQHTTATDQVFTPEAVHRAYELSCGQPWIVNAIANECVCGIHKTDLEPVTLDDVNAARESLVRRRDTHFDSLLERLKEPRIRSVVEPVILGEDRSFDLIQDDCVYVQDLGILKDTGGTLVPANPMYAELIGRALTWSLQCDAKRKVPDLPWVTEDGIDMDWMMKAFQKFWRENAESAPDLYGYKESFGHLTLMAFLQRVTNGKGQINREMALGSGRLDLYVEFGKGRYAIEAKLKKRFNEEELKKTAKYLDSLGLDEGFMPVFDPDKSKSWDERCWLDTKVVDGKTIHCYGV